MLRFDQCVTGKVTLVSRPSIVGLFRPGPTLAFGTMWAILRAGHAVTVAKAGMVVQEPTR